MSIGFKDAVAIEEKLWPEELDPWSPETPNPERGDEKCVLFLHKNKLVLNCSDPYYSGGVPTTALRHLLRLCATALLAEETEDTNYVSFSSPDGTSLLSVRGNGTIGVAVSDDHYAGDTSAEDALKLALLVLRQGAP